MRRRTFLKGLGLGLGATLLSPLVERLVGVAMGNTMNRLNFVVLTDGNGWTHQSGGSRNSPTLDPYNFRSETDWELPEVLAPLAPWSQKVTICRPLRNTADTDLHGNGWGTLSGARGDKQSPGGRSIDRCVALDTGIDDAFPSIALGVATRSGRRAPCVSADGPRRPFPAIAHPQTAHATLFGTGDNALDDLARRRSLLDGVMEDIRRTQRALAAPERVRLEQILDSYRAIEQQLSSRSALLEGQPLPEAPSEEVNDTLNAATVRGHIGVMANALTFGLTHVAHLSLLGFNAHNVGWGFLGYGGDAHENVAHVSGSYNRDRSTEAYTAQIQFKAGELAHLYGLLDAIPNGDRTLAEDTVFLWVNSGGGKHHDGAAWHPLVLMGDAHGRLKCGHFLELDNRPYINEAFLAIVQALGVQTDTFGDPERCPGPLSALLT
ncbi:MAG: DUF1552 domain-containing protein [Myxococcota bacterium]